MREDSWLTADDGQELSESDADHELILDTNIATSRQTLCSRPSTNSNSPTHGSIRR